MKINYCRNCEEPLKEGKCLSCSPTKENPSNKLRCNGRDGHYQCAMIKPLYQHKKDEYYCVRHHEEVRPKGFIDKLFDENLSECKKEQTHLGLTGYEYFKLKYGSLKEAIKQIGGSWDA